MNKLIKSSAIIIGALAILQATAYGAGNASVSVKIDKLSGLFVLNMSDSQGIKSFSFQPTGTDKLPYSGDLSGCPKNRTQDNVVFSTADFNPFMKAVITDCRGEETEFEIYAPNESGVSKVVKIEKAAPPPPTPAPAPAQTPSAAPAETAAATNPLATLNYPIKELGNCASEKACKAYCESSANMERCIAFAEEHNLLPHEEIARGKKFIEVVKSGGGPNGCKTENECESYCNDISHINECVAFAEEHNFLSEKELAEAKKVKAAIDSGKKFPGDCRNKKACEAYCQSPEHIDECFAFAKESGFMSEEELKQAEKFIPLMKAGKSPGGCKTKETCEAFCEDENNFDACMAFAEEAGLLSDQEKEIIKKTGGKGPGGCKGRACQTFCDNPANQDACFEFAKEHGLISEEDLKHAEEGMKFMRESIQNASPEVKECVEKIIGAPGLVGGEPGKGLAFSGPEIGEKMRECFQNIIPEGARGDFEFGSSGEFQGPGGCKSHEECEAYCRSNPEACGFGGGGGPPAGGFGGPDPGTSFLDCVSVGMTASYVCGINGKGATSGVETTYFNECHAKQHGTEILHEGVCIRNGQPDKPCSDIADPVCGNDNNTWVSACHAEDQGGGVQYKGVCKGPGGGGGGGGRPGGGPGGCQSQEECEAYCREHPTECGVTSPPPPLTQSCAPLPSSLVSWVDDTLSGSSGGVTIATGKVGNALKFDASGGYVTDENSEKLNFGTGPFSLETWFNWDGGGSSKGNIIRKANYPVSGDGAGYWLAISKDSGTLEFFAGETVGNPGKARGSVSLPISSGVWYHVAATRNGNGTMSLYINGQLKGAAEAANANTTSPAPFTLGAWDDRFGITELFSGLIDEVSVYNRALTSSEVQAIFNAGSNGKCSESSPQQYQQQYPSADQYQQQNYQQYQGTQPTTDFSGPGGCKTPDECTAYCTKNYQDPACQQFAPPPSSFSPGSVYDALLRLVR